MRIQLGSAWACSVGSSLRRLRGPHSQLNSYLADAHRLEIELGSLKAVTRLCIGQASMCVERDYLRIS